MIVRHAIAASEKRFPFRPLCNHFGEALRFTEEASEVNCQRCRKMLGLEQQRTQREELKCAWCGNNFMRPVSVVIASAVPCCSRDCSRLYSKSERYNFFEKIITGRKSK